MKKFLMCLAALAMAGCATLSKPEPSPYDGKCYQAGPVQIKIYHRDTLEVDGETKDGYKFAVVNLMFGQYGEGVAPTEVVEKDLTTGVLEEVDCSVQDWDTLAKDFAEWRKEQEAGKKE